MQNHMFDFLSTFKTAPHAIRAYLSNKRHKRELLWDFVLDAIGLPESLSPDNHAPRTVSFLMIDLRIRLLQQREPDRARKCGAPAVGDVMREVKIKEVLHELVSAGKLQGCRQGDRWEISSGDVKGQRLRA